MPLVALVVMVGVAMFLLLRGGRAEHFTEGMMGRPAPAFALARLDGGEPLTSEAMRGRPYVINMFASWCTPCRAEHPQLDGAARRAAWRCRRRLQGSGRRIRGAFLTELAIRLARWRWIRRGASGLKLGVTGVPETFVIGADGRVLSVYRGTAHGRRGAPRSIAPALEAAPG